MIINCAVVKGAKMEHVEEAHMVVEGGRITQVGDGFENGGVDMRNCVAVPGLINAHTHVGDSFAKEACEGLDVSSAVGREGRKWEIYEKAGKEEVLSAMKETIDFMLNTGTATFVDFREQGKAGVDMLKGALKDSSLKSIILGRDIPIEYCDGLGLNTYHLDQIPRDRKGKIVAVHAGERRGEVEKALEANPDIIVHFTTATKEEIKKAAEKKIGVVVCPRANAYLGVGTPKVRDMLDSNITVALGTDNVMLNSPDMWREMEFAYKQGRLSGGLEPEEVLRMATVNAARIFKLDGGAIQRDRRADIIFIDMDSQNLRHSRNVVSALVNRTEPGNVKRVMIDGVFAK